MYKKYKKNMKLSKGVLYQVRDKDSIDFYYNLRLRQGFYIADEAASETNPWVYIMLKKD